MEIGDMVVRAYAWNRFIPGIIVEERDITYPGDETSDEGWTETQFVVQWSDGQQSLEMLEELDEFEASLEAHQEFWGDKDE